LHSFDDIPVIDVSPLIPGFDDLDSDTVVECPPHRATANSPAKYPPIVAGATSTADMTAPMAGRRAGAANG
jgi:hypothetical protein